MCRKKLIKIKTTEVDSRSRQEVSQLVVQTECSVSRDGCSDVSDNQNYNISDGSNSSSEMTKQTAVIGFNETLRMLGNSPIKKRKITRKKYRNCKIT